MGWAGCLTGRRSHAHRMQCLGKMPIFCRSAFAVAVHSAGLPRHLHCPAQGVGCVGCTPVYTRGPAPRPLRGGCWGAMDHSPPPSTAFFGTPNEPPPLSLAEDVVRAGQSNLHMLLKMTVLAIQLMAGRIQGAGGGGAGNPLL